MLVRTDMCFVFVFFKQKTAYEMRISDWSSDVCSSDLDDVPLAILTRQDGRLRRRREFPVPFDLHLTGDSDKANPTALPERQTIAHPELGGVITGRCTEARKSCLVAALHPSEERPRTPCPACAGPAARR